MATVHTRYVTWISRGRRHHGSAALDIVPPLSTAASNPGLYQAWASPSITWTDGAGQHTALFAFWSVTGAPDGSSASTNNSLSVNVGPSDVNATAWYIPAGGGGPGGPGVPGVLIDAFDVNLGMFVDDDFVAVTPDAGLTAAANNDGFVLTASAENIDAFASIHAVPFENWTVVVGTEVVNNLTLQGAVGSIAVAFAFYQTPKRIPGLGRQYETGTWVSYGVTVDAGGPTGHGPVPPWTPFVMEIAAGLALGQAATLLRKDLRGSALEVAAKQITAAAKNISEKMQGK